MALLTFFQEMVGCREVMVMRPVVIEEEMDFSSDAESEDEEAAETKTEGGDQ